MSLTEHPQSRSAQKTPTSFRVPKVHAQRLQCILLQAPMRKCLHTGMLPDTQQCQNQGCDLTHTDNTTSCWLPSSPDTCLCRWHYCVHMYAAGRTAGGSPGRRRAARLLPPPAAQKPVCWDPRPSKLLCVTPSSSSCITTTVTMCLQMMHRGLTWFTSQDWPGLAVWVHPESESITLRRAQHLAACEACACWPARSCGGRDSSTSGTGCRWLYRSACRYIQSRRMTYSWCIQRRCTLTSEQPR